MGEDKGMAFFLRALAKQHVVNVEEVIARGARSR